MEGNRETKDRSISISSVKQQKSALETTITHSLCIRPFQRKTEPSVRNTS